MLYFAYGSNMNAERMIGRCGSAKPLGPAELVGCRLVERRFADIDADGNESVHGLLWSMEMHDLPALDAYEGYPRLYTRHVVPVDLHAHRKHVTVPAVVYEMTGPAKTARDGLRYEDFYWAICSDGAKQNGVKLSPFWQPRKTRAHTD